jgi:hypothetical protein
VSEHEIELLGVRGSDQEADLGLAGAMRAERLAVGPT